MDLILNRLSPDQQEVSHNFEMQNHLTRIDLKNTRKSFHTHTNAPNFKQQHKRRFHA